MGGIALGNGVTNSGLLEVLGDGIRKLISGMELYPVVLLLSVIVLVRCMYNQEAYLQLTDMIRIGYFDVHQPHHRKRALGPDREGSREEHAWRRLLEPPHLHHRPHLLRRDGHARLWLPEPDCVRFPVLSPLTFRAGGWRLTRVCGTGGQGDAGGRDGPVVPLQRRLPQERRACECHRDRRRRDGRLPAYAGHPVRFPRSHIGPSLTFCLFSSV